MIRRTSGWEGRFNRQLALLDGTPFKWGRTDCAMIAARMVDALCETEFYKNHVDRYSSFREAFKFAHNRYDVSEFFIREGCSIVIDDEPQPGDILFFPNRGMKHCVVCAANNIGLTSSESVGRVYATWVSTVLTSKKVETILRVE